MAEKREEFSHIGSAGEITMVNVGAKSATRREAIASALVRMHASTMDLLMRKALPKGDVLTTAKVAGIMAAKQTSSLIPLTHPLALEYVDLTFQTLVDQSAIEVRAVVRCEGKTGVEIEALTACAIASLTIYDMCKSADKSIVIDSLRLLRKSGGKSGTYEAD